jgi:hypothetical protein
LIVVIDSGSDGLHDDGERRRSSISKSIIVCI